MSQTQHNPNIDSTGTQPVTTTDDIWAIKREDGHITLRLADYTPPNGYAELESTFSEHLTDLRSSLEYGTHPTTVGTATLTTHDHTDEPTITNIEPTVTDTQTTDEDSTDTATTTNNNDDETKTGFGTSFGNGLGQ